MSGVLDTGMGIPESDQAKVFQEFQRVQSGPNTQVEGTGLGLTLVKRFVELHGGWIHLLSAPNAGSTFTLGFPRKTLEPRLELLPPVDSGPQKQGDTHLPDSEEVQVLVVEPDLQAAALLMQHLSDAGYTAAVACDPKEGWDKLNEQRPEVLVFDLLRCGSNGGSFLDRLRGDPTTKDLPVIIVSIVEELSGSAVASEAAAIPKLNARQLVERLKGMGLQKQTAPVRILAIDDDPRTTELLAASLEPVGFEVLKAANGQQGLEMAAQKQPDLIVLDLLMPDMNGFEVLERLEQGRLTQDMPIIIFTIKHLSLEEKHRLKGRIAGVAEKGAFNKDAFVGIVGRTLQRSRKRGNSYEPKSDTDR